MKIVKLLFLVLCAVVAVYLVLPSPDFPDNPPNSIQSTEPGDTESIYRRAYYTNSTRDEIMSHYFNQFGGWGIKLDRPREEAPTVIRDQTRSSYLEEFVHPGRESLYVNVFVPILAKDQINIDDVHYLNKVTVRLIPSPPIGRLTVLVMTAMAIVALAHEYARKK